MAHARGLCAIIAPLVNSYKRLVPGYEAPVYISWARINRSALIRVPRISQIEATRLELRCPDPSCNPYLAFAAMLAAGLDGIEKGMTPPAALEENLYELDDARREDRQVATLPGSLGEALACLAEDKVIQLQSQLSDEIDADLATVISDLSQRQLALEASMRVIGQTSQLTVLNFL